jgi:hypothetical protein
MAEVADLSFTEISESSGASLSHQYGIHFDRPESIPDVLKMAGGVAAGDIDRDGDVDLYVITGDARPNGLLVNDGAGHYTDAAEQAGVALPGHQSSGPVFADVDGDGWLDLTVGGMGESGMMLFRNNGDGTFSDITPNSGVTRKAAGQNDFSSAFGDPDGDGDLDLFVAHWGTDAPVNHLWVNSGAGAFMPADAQAELDELYRSEIWGFSPVFADVDSDGRQDLLVASDFGTSHVLLNRDGLRFANNTTEEIDDSNGMGSAVGDFDNDGDLDWFVTSIWWGPSYPEPELMGNRLYRNDGAGNFSNATDEAGVLEGDWGWSACAADFANDGWLDLFHVNGMFWDWSDIDFSKDPSRLFLNNGDGSFREKAIELGINDRGQGRGLVCFDADQDGDIDIFTSNLLAPTRLFRNDLKNNPGYLQVALVGEPDNPTAIGARIELTVNGITQLRELTVGSNYLSQNPLLQHFGLGGAGQVDRLRVSWPHGGVTLLHDLEINRKLTLSAMESEPPPFAIEAGISAAWYDPDREGEGFVIEVLEGQRAVLYWFTYDGEGKQDWYTAVGEVRGRRILFPRLLRASGGIFGADFDPSLVSRDVVGTAAFSWAACDRGFMDWNIAESMGRQELVRLTTLMGAECGNSVPKVPGTQARLSGSWYDPSHDGEGYVLEMMNNGKPIVYWFSYDPNGDRRWFFGLGEVSGGKLVFDRMLTTIGGRFGDGFDPGEVTLIPWGELELDIDCSGGTARYESVQDGFGEGELQIRQATRLAGLECN